MPVKDIRIVGGGFAGVVTALELLAGRHAGDYRITIYEREAAAHTTLCGEGLSHATLEQFTAFDWRPFVAEEFPGASWAFPGGVRVLVNQRCYTMARERWIPAMARAAEKLGATYLTGEKVTPERVREMSREADLVIGADGPGSQVRKVVGGLHETCLGLQYRVERSAYETDRLEFVTDKRWSPEYAWIFPRGDMHNVGLLADPALPMDENWRRLDAFAAVQGVQGKVLKREAYPIGFFGTTVQSGNVVLVGDAAGLTNPITKGGMAAVVYAAEILAACVQEDRVEHYETRIRSHPLATPEFRDALAVIHRWTNRDFERLARFAPPTMTVGEGVASARRRYLGPMLVAMAMNPGKVRDLDVLARAMGVSRRYSW